MEGGLGLQNSGRGQNLQKHTRSVIINHFKEGRSVAYVHRVLKARHGTLVSKQTLYKIRDSPSIETPSRSGRPRKILPVHLLVLDMWMLDNPEMTAEQVQQKLQESFGVEISRQHVTRLRQNLGWQTRRVKYCQLITNKNKKLRVDWCLGALSSKEKFLDVIFTDETSIEMSSSGRIFFFRKKSDFEKLPAKSSKPKHSYKVHLWGGISYRGRTNCCIFTGIMDSLIYQQILAKNLLPWTEKKFPDGFRLYQDNDSKHVSKSTKKWMEDVGMLDKVMTTPASSPDLNPIENVWATLKDHLQRKVKPRTKDQLVDGIVRWWTSLSASQCARYIQHIHRVIPQVILNDGGPTEF